MDEVVPKRKKHVKSTPEELLKLDKSELVQKIIQLEAHNFQLKNIISKGQCDHTSTAKFERKNPYDFSKCHFRKVLLQINYFGWDYQGLAVQEDSPRTIEHHLFNALTRSCLIENRESSDYHRCGRTDKGVSAFGQVISIRLRSKLPPDQQHNTQNEILYCKLLNRILPKEIRAIAWAPLTDTNVSARFDCKRRAYKYYFPESSLDVEAMRSACKHLVGNHDFRNLCKMDVANGVVEFRRTVFKADIVHLNDSNAPMLYLHIEGNAFLWHQIRCIMGLLLLVGSRRETPEVVAQMLDVETNPCKPQYNMALDTPLNLFHSTYELDDSAWVYDGEELRYLVSEMQGFWTLHSVKATMIWDCLRTLENRLKSVCKSETKDDSVESERDIMSHTDCLLQGVKPKVYKPLLKRDKCSSLQNRIEHYKKKRKVVNYEEIGNKSD